MYKETIWKCIHKMEALCSRDDVSTVDRKRLEETFTQVYDILVEAAADKTGEGISWNNVVFDTDDPNLTAPPIPKRRRKKKEGIAR